ERLAAVARQRLPQASDRDIEEIASLAFQVPNEIFRRRNLWGLELV
ncbi:MAG: hypothetical protein HY721_17090, partial [Planctomycetes bacterium]|nr:hypothetical protein [Planctomycetota bacterium]